MKPVTLSLFAPGSETSEPGALATGSDIVEGGDKIHAKTRQVGRVGTYPGGKGGAGVYQTIINQMPPHDLYIEAFVGGGAILRHKKPAIKNVAIDRDSSALSALAGFSEEVLLFHGDALDLLPTFAPMAQSTLIYADPPYVMSTRKSGPIYNYEMDDADHVRLLELLVSLPCMVMISGYPSDLYDSLLTGWRTVDFWAMTRSGKPALERLWMNYPEPFELHDYRYLGSGYRERERIKRKQVRWKRKLAAMPPLERYALLSALHDIESP